MLNTKKTCGKILCYDLIFLPIKMARHFTFLHSAEESTNFKKVLGATLFKHLSIAHLRVRRTSNDREPLPQNFC